MNQNNAASNFSIRMVSGCDQGMDAEVFVDVIRLLNGDTPIYEFCFEYFAPVGKGRIARVDVERLTDNDLLAPETSMNVWGLIAAINNFLDKMLESQGAEFYADMFADPETGESIDIPIVF